MAFGIPGFLSLPNFGKGNNEEEGGLQCDNHNGNGWWVKS